MNTVVSTIATTVEHSHSNLGAFDSAGITLIIILEQQVDTGLILDNLEHLVKLPVEHKRLAVP